MNSIAVRWNRYHARGTFDQIKTTSHRRRRCRRETIKVRRSQVQIEVHHCKWGSTDWEREGGE